jgi:hypothetical protein
VHQEAEELNKDIQRVVSNLNKNFDNNKNESNKDNKQDQEQIDLIMKRMLQMEAKYDALK